MIELSHTAVLDNIQRALARQIDRRFSWIVAAFGLVIRKSPLTTRVPSLAVFERSTVIAQGGSIHSVPQLVVQVPPARDALADYASLGVPEAWVVSPESRTVEVLYLENGQFRRTQILDKGVLTPKLFPQVRLDLADIWPA